MEGRQVGFRARIGAMVLPGLLAVAVMAGPVASRGQIAGSPPPPAAEDGADLLAKVPDAIAGECVVSVGSAEGEVAVADCGTRVAAIGSVSYHQFVDAASMGKALEGYLTDAAGQGAGADCQVGPSIVGWAADDGSLGGTLVCLDGADTATSFAWTDDQLLILAVAGSSASYPDTYAWWLSAGPVRDAGTVLPAGLLYDAGDFSAWGAGDYWSASGGVLAHEDMELADWIYAPEAMPSDDYVVVVEVLMPKGSTGMTVAVRSDDAGPDHQAVGWNSFDQVAFIGRDGPRVIEASLEGLDDGKWHEWRVAAVGTDFSLSVDGTKVVEGADPAHLTGRYVGFGSGSVFAARDFRVFAP